MPELTSHEERALVVPESPASRRCGDSDTALDIEALQRATLGAKTALVRWSRRQGRRLR
jgi:hypothetical protein